MAALCLNKQVEMELRALPGNNICCDCDGKTPQWASVSFGIFMCLECSGRHRALGVHISFVRSVSMDSWTDKQINMMRLGGNDKFNNFLKQYNVAKSLTIAQKYNTSAALYYREKLSAEANGLPPPSNLPTAYSESSSGKNTDSKGSDPLPGETEAEYVVRQKRLQEEARERMRQKFGSTSGLNSSGRMQGIGSDANYRPGQTDAAGLPIDVNQLAEVSQKALSFLSTSFSVLGEQVTKTTQQLLDEANKPSTNNPPPQNSANSANEFAFGWDNLTTGAASLWKQASVATADIISIINNPEQEEDLRFPRPSTDNLSNNTQTSSAPVVSRQSPHPSSSNLSSDSSWDSLSDIAPKKSVSNSNFQQQQSNNSTLPPSIPAPDRMSRASSSTHSSSDRLSTPLSLPSPAPKVASTPSKKPVEAPAGDDFFATFGV